MDLVLIILLSLVVVGIGYLVWELKFARKPEANDQTLTVLLNQLDNLRRELSDSSGQNRKEMQDRIDNISLQINRHQVSSHDIIKEITQKLANLDATNKQVVSFAEQMQNLENILKNPKQRGVLGEFMLESLLQNVLPPHHYEMQYKFKNGEVVDAAVFFRDMVIPIDAKFSLEKYNQMMQEMDATRRGEIEKEFKRDVKNRIDETAKYVRPSDGTTDFAFMFIPAEGVYYNLLIYDVGSVKVNTQDLVEYAFSKRVVIVSPTSFYAYLKTVLQGLKALQIESQAKEIMGRVGDLSRHLTAYGDFMNKVGNHLGTTVSMYNQASREFRKIDKDVIKITAGEYAIGGEAVSLDKPSDNFDN